MGQTHMMAARIRQATEADLPFMMAVDGRAFHSFYSEVDQQFARQAIDLDRFVVAVDGTELVALAGSFEFDLTLPGNARVPMAGVTWVAVAATHRRQGVLRQLMASIDNQAAERSEPLMGLGSSEGGIYGRFGYGPVNRMRNVAIDRKLAEFIDPTMSRPGAVRITYANEVIGALAERWDRYRQTQHGEVPRTESELRFRLHQAGPGTIAALHDDGFAIWTAKRDWNGGLPAAELDVIDFCAATAAAHADLWKTILATDLVGSVISSRAVTDHDLLPSLLVNPRIVRTTSLHDNLWLKVLDPVASFAARSYRIDDRIVVATDRATFAVERAGCAPTDQQPDLTLAATATGPLLMGGVTASELAAQGLVRATPDVLHRADAFFGHSPAPVTRIEF